MPQARCFAAVDLGATSGRVILGRLVDLGSGALRFELEQTGRFVHDGLAAGAELHWSFATLTDGVLAGLREAERRCRERGEVLESIGIDTWAVDYGLLDETGQLLGDPFHYRDSRTEGVPDRVFEALGADELHCRCGLQIQPFNTIFQLVAERADWSRVARLLLMPDLLGHWLTGRAVAEVTNASTTGLFDVRARSWSPETLADLERIWGVPAARVLPELVEPGTSLGRIRPELLDTTAQLVSVGSHDTASAIVSVPARGERFAYISSGTWSLVGLELDAPVLTEASRAANFTNELGVDGTVRYLKNVMGLWVLTESIRCWAEAGEDVSLPELLSAAAELPALACVVDINHPSLLPPGDMPSRIAALAGASGQRVPGSPAEFTRCILDSLALAYRGAIDEACRLSGREVDVVHIVGGGSNNVLLCQLTASATGREVVAGPDEGTAMGNLLVQARAMGALAGGLDTLREVVRQSTELIPHHPDALGITPDAWVEAWARIH